MSDIDVEVEAFRLLEENYPQEWKDEAYAMVLDTLGRFIEKNKLRSTNFPKRANSAIYVLALGLAKKKLVLDRVKAEEYLESQLIRIRDGAYNVVDDIFREIASL